MEPKQKWEIIINTGGDPLKSMLTLNGELIACSEANIMTSSDNAAFLVIKVPIVDGNLDIKTDASKPVFRETIIATAKKE